MPTKRRRLTRPLLRVDVTRALFTLLVWDDFTAACAIADRDGSNPWELFGTAGEHARAWAAIEADALQAWIAVHPGSRPRSWWHWSAPELRAVYGRFSIVIGAGRCQDTGIPYGGPTDWDDLPMVESEPACLDRLSLWLPGERARVEANAFEAQPFAWTLMHAPRGGPV